MQSLIDFLYRNPRSQLRTFGRFGGYINYRKMMHGRKLMEKRSVELPPVISKSDGLPVYFLTGKNYLYQTLYCIQSLSVTTATPFKFILVDDGSMNDALMERIHRQLPGAEIITQSRIGRNLQKSLPADLYPCLHYKRKVYPHIKKLTDIHTIPGGTWKLVLDSDMLFWNKPDELIQWLTKPEQPLHMIDCSDAYGYSKKLMEELSGSKISPLINVGAIGLNSQTINWAELETWVKTLEAREGTTYYLEQALSAMLIGNSSRTVLPAEKYIVNPDNASIDYNRGVLHHYVDLSKEGYFKTSWKKLI
ncbi:hypothetical protein [Mucilaginibacter aquariorum]|uniref:Glycosyl transferase n=1 Tax=Mucilaginibacter aquariorum TaxID=2967225 RepID=A0ABT1SY64_9SPHI|nr:hypothetical protein [Mucilaginibacter aquariorum]MCQ6957287.1 hypothetical protein [Mucilaginibacter aquariorum]